MKYIFSGLFKLIFLFFFSFNLNAQIKWVDSELDTAKTTVFVYAPRIGYSHYLSNKFEIGYGLYICNEDNTIENERESNWKNLLQISNSFNLSIEYSKINSVSVWAPKFSYVAGFTFLALRGDVLWQTQNFKKGYLATRIGAGLGFYNIGVFAMKELSLNNSNPYKQNWGISISTFIWGGGQKWKVRN